MPDRLARFRTLLALGLCCLVLIAADGCFWWPGSSPSTSGGTGGGTSGGPANPSVSASLLEQLALERINRARLRPAEEAARYGIAIDEGIPGQLNTTPKQPLTLNATLNDTARAHSQDMIDRDYFAHDTPEGVSPFTRMTNAGYAYSAAGENLAWRGTTGGLVEPDTVEAQHQDLFVDTGIAGRGHRVAMLTEVFREVGVGVVRGQYTQGGTTYDSIMQTQDYGAPAGGGTFVLGVVYDDRNANGQYDHGEGTASAVVTLGTTAKTTNAAGGYSFEVRQAGVYTLSFSAGPSQAFTFSAGAPNLKVDLVDGTTLVVNLGVGPLTN